MSPGTDPLGDSASHPFCRTSLFSQAKHPHPKAKTKTQLDLQSREKAPTADSGQRTVRSVGTYLCCPSTATSSHLPRSFFQFKNIQLCLGDEQNEMSLTYKKREERVMRYIPYKYIEIKAGL